MTEDTERHAERCTFGQSIVLAKNKAADMALHSGTAKVCQEGDYVVLPVETIFDVLWMSGIFEAINRACQSHIDEYESDTIDAVDLPKVLVAIDQATLRISGDIIADFRTRFRDLCAEGIENQLPLHFDF